VHRLDANLALPRALEPALLLLLLGTGAAGALPPLATAAVAVAEAERL